MDDGAVSEAPRQMTTHEETTQRLQAFLRQPFDVAIPSSSGCRFGLRRPYRYVNRTLNRGGPYVRYRCTRVFDRLPIEGCSVPVLEVGDLKDQTWS